MGCRREVSEWAARCPLCGRPLDDAEVTARPDAGEPAAPAATHRTSAGDGVPVGAGPAELASGATRRRSAGDGVPVGAGAAELASGATRRRSAGDGVPVGAAPADVAVADRRRRLYPERLSRQRAGLLAVAAIAAAALALGLFTPGQGGPSGHSAKSGASAHKAQGGHDPATTPTTRPAKGVPPSLLHSPHGSVRGRLPPAAVLRRLPSAAVLRRLPPGLASERLFFAEPVRTGLYRADGSMITNLTDSAGIGYPLEPLVSGRGVVVYIHGDYAYRTDPHNRHRVVRLAPATWIFPAEHGAIGIESGGFDSPASVAYMAADGTFPELGTPSVVVAPGITAVAQVPRGLIVAAGATLEELLNQVTHVRLSLIEAHSTVSLGMATSVVGVYGATAALVNCPSRGLASCALRLVNTTTHRVRSIRPPPGYVGFAQGGGFSPNGKLLATFVPSPGPDGSSVLHLAVMRLSTGTTTVVGPSLIAAQELVGDATWSADGHWVYFGSLSGTLDAEKMTRTGPAGNPWTLPLTTSFAVIGD
jgi:hypothetical protein